ncbi:hypothetical protein [Clostridium sp. 001]|uniref:hypothetical protein n=1 Tax=Clostridium sp. 001 TaxID=1970093 RepID=UPI001C2BA693|nr:hypothetical protein [Clostridium sp. 001]QXE18694.1 hypothetical protein B5S50_07505 [Clostridium sp. 001]
MNNIVPFILGVISSIIATIICGFAIIFYKGAKGFPGIKIACRLIIDCVNSGIVNLFSCRKVYSEHKDHGSPSDYIKKAECKVMYVGFWLSHGTEIGDITETIKYMILRNKKVIIVFINPNNDVVLTSSSEFLGISKDEVKTRVRTSIKKIADLYEQVPVEYHHNLELKIHDVPLTASAFLLDFDSVEQCRILVDYKSYGFSREDSYGIEYRNKNKKLCKLLCDSYEKIYYESSLLDINNIRCIK